MGLLLVSLPWRARSLESRLSGRTAQGETTMEAERPTLASRFRPMGIDAEGLNELRGHVTVHWMMGSVMHDGAGQMGMTLVRNISVVARARPGRPRALT